MNMTFEQIEERWRRWTGSTDPGENGLRFLPLKEQLKVCARAFDEEVADNPEFSPMVWTVTFLGFSKAVWSAALAVEAERGTQKENTEATVMAFMEHADPGEDQVWRGVLRFMEDLEVTPELIRKGLDRLETLSRSFLEAYEEDRDSPKSRRDVVDREHRADETRMLLRFGLPELRRRLKARDAGSSA